MKSTPGQSSGQQQSQAGTGNVNDQNHSATSSVPGVRSAQSGGLLRGWSPDHHGLAASAASAPPRALTGGDQEQAASKHLRNSEIAAAADGSSLFGAGIAGTDELIAEPVSRSADARAFIEFLISIAPQAVVASSAAILADVSKVRALLPTDTAVTVGCMLVYSMSPASVLDFVVSLAESEMNMFVVALARRARSDTARSVVADGQGLLPSPLVVRLAPSDRYREARRDLEDATNEVAMGELHPNVEFGAAITTITGARNSIAASRAGTSYSPMHGAPAAHAAVSPQPLGPLTTGASGLSQTPLGAHALAGSASHTIAPTNRAACAMSASSTGAPALPNAHAAGPEQVCIPCPAIVTPGTSGLVSDLAGTHALAGSVQGGNNDLFSNTNLPSTAYINTPSLDDFLDAAMEASAAEAAAAAAEAGGADPAASDEVRK